jgi:hypothetical protein
MSEFDRHLLPDGPHQSASNRQPPAVSRLIKVLPWPNGMTVTPRA